MSETVRSPLFSTALREALGTWVAAARLRTWALARAAAPDAVLLLLVLFVAAVPRLVQIGDLPSGLHGDEAAAGLEAREIVRNGWQGVYTPQALGIPTGTMYGVAAVFQFAGDSVTSLRLAYALMGTATVGITYLAVRVMFDRFVALPAAGLLATLPWHLHYSRLAFIPLGWPLMQMLALCFLFLGVRRRSRMLYGLAGASLGAGIYTYQAFVITLPAFAAGLLIIGIMHYRRRPLEWVASVAVLCGVALLVALPMIDFARANENIYTGRYRQQSALKTEEYESSDFLGRVDYLLDREREFITRVVDEPRFDNVDGAGLIALVDPITFVLFLAGGVILVLRLPRDPAYAVTGVLILVIAAGPALQVDGAYRRGLGLAPLVCLVAALPLGSLMRDLARRSARLGAAAALAVLLVVGAASWRNVDRYFSAYDDSQHVRHLFFPEMRAASEYMDALPDGTYVYLYSGRAGFGFEGRRYLAPDAQGEDRSREFAADGYSIEADRSRDVVYVLMERYVDDIGDIGRRYPGGRAQAHRDDEGRLLFVTYELAAEEDRAAAR